MPNTLTISEAIAGDQLEVVVDRFESARASDPDVDVAHFFPDASSPDYSDIVLELLRVDFELSWAVGADDPVARYIQRFGSHVPESALIDALTFEDFRLRQNSDEPRSSAAYRERYGVDTSTWPQLSPEGVGGDTRRELTDDTSPDGNAATLRRLTDYADTLPRAGTTFAGFQLTRVLGEGVFGRVFEATQPDLAARSVALKITVGHANESQHLARLQHTHIVPIYSVHSQRGLVAICMPLLGQTTLRQELATLRRPHSAADDQASGDSDRPVSTTLRWAREIADGLEHAHRRGILHRDLKPANVLLADDGRAMLLDFNVSQDLAPQASHDLLVGGTLPYMSPEQLRSLQTPCQLKEQSDIYAFGILLFEMLTGHRPFRESRAAAARSSYFESSAPTIFRETGEIEHALHERCTFPPIRANGRTITSDLASLLNRCLAFEPADRYRSMAEVLEDLDRHLADLPLRHAAQGSWAERFAKWRRRHPRLVSGLTVSVGSVLVVLSLAMLLWSRHHKLMEARAADQLRELRDEIAQLRIDGSPVGADLSRHVRNDQRAGELLRAVGSIRGNELVSPQIPPHLTADQRIEYRDALAETLYWFAQAKLMRESAQPKHSWRLVQARRANALARQLFAPGEVPHGLQRQALRLEQASLGTDRQQADEALPIDVDSNDYVAACEALRYGDLEDAIRRWTALRDRHPGDYATWIILGDALFSAGRFDDARACYDHCVLMWPDSPRAYRHRGILRLFTREHAKAVADFSEVVGRLPNDPTALLNRALAQLESGNAINAESDATMALELDSRSPRAHFLRMRARRMLGDARGAQQDLETGLKLKPRDAIELVSQGREQLRRDPLLALASFRAAYRWNRRCRDALRGIAHVYGECLDDQPAALEKINEAIARFGGQADDIIARGVLHARMGNAELAIADAEAILKSRPTGKQAFQAACVFALLAEDRPHLARRARSALALAFRRNPRWIDVAASDPDLAGIRRHPKFRALLASARTVYANLGRADLDPETSED